MKQVIALILICCFISGCSTLVLKERERALDEAFEKGKINKTEYYSLKNDLKREQDEMVSKKRRVL